MSDDADGVDAEKYADEHGAFALKEAADAFEEAADAVNDLHVQGLTPADLDDLRDLQGDLHKWADRFDHTRSDCFSDGVSES